MMISLSTGAAAPPLGEGPGVPGLMGGQPAAIPSLGAASPAGIPDLNAVAGAVPMGPNALPNIAVPPNGQIDLGSLYRELGMVENSMGLVPGGAGALPTMHGAGGVIIPTNNIPMEALMAYGPPINQSAPPPEAEAELEGETGEPLEVATLSPEELKALQKDADKAKPTEDADDTEESASDNEKQSNTVQANGAVEKPDRPIEEVAAEARRFSENGESPA